MQHDTMRADGGWTVELVKPLAGSNGAVSSITIRPPSLDTSLRWADKEIHTMLALLSSLSDVPESLLRQLTWPDVDRVMMALGHVLPAGSNMRTDFVEGNRPMATPRDELPEAEEADVPDQKDSRFPAGDGPVRRFNKPPTVTLPVVPKRSADDSSDTGFDMSVPETAQAVGR